MLPEQFLKRMEEMLGEEFPAFLESYDRERYQALRINTLKKSESGEDVADVLTALFDLERVPWAQNGYYYPGDKQPGKHPYHEAGVYYIQEPSAMAPVEKLNVEPGDVVLDLCAAPGGKSTQIAAKLDGKGMLLCNEIHPARARILSENVERMGIWNACVCNETPEHLAKVFPVYFNRILVDAPCSGEGMFRKNEGAIEEWSPENVELCASRQDAILDCAAEMLCPGGRMVYSTCTFAPQENEGSVERFLERHPEFTLIERERLYPHRVKGEGHFLAVFEKEGSSDRATDHISGNGLEKELDSKKLPDWYAFERETLARPLREVFPDSKYIGFGESIYLAPAMLPGLKGLRVLRPGLQLGFAKKNRFEPSHALALALSPKDFRHTRNLASADCTCTDYLNGQTFPAEGEKGWYGICVDGYTLGWGKLAGNQMKNHYPKGLRKP